MAFVLNRAYEKAMCVPKEDGFYFKCFEFCCATEKRRGLSK